MVTEEKESEQTPLTPFWRQTNSRDLTNRSLKTDGDKKGGELKKGCIESEEERQREKAGRDLTNRSLETERQTAEICQTVSADRPGEGEWRTKKGVYGQSEEEREGESEQRPYKQYLKTDKQKTELCRVDL